MSKYSGIDNINKPAFDAIVPKVKEGIEKGEIPIPAGGTKLYKHTIVLPGITTSKLTFLSTSSTPITTMAGLNVLTNNIIFLNIMYGTSLVNGNVSFLGATASKTYLVCVGHTGGISSATPSIIKLEFNRGDTVTDTVDEL